MYRLKQHTTTIKLNSDLLSKLAIQGDKALDSELDDFPLAMGGWQNEKDEGSGDLESFSITGRLVVRSTELKGRPRGNRGWGIIGANVARLR